MMKNTANFVNLIFLVFLLMLIMPLLVSCSGTAESNNTFIELLKMLPAEAKEGRVITIIDYESFRKVNGISFYDEDNQRLTNEEFRDNIMNLSKAGNLFAENILQYGSYWTGLNDDILSSTIQDNNIGYNLTDVNGEINNIYSVSITSLGMGKFDYNSNALVVAIGDFDARYTEHALNNRDEWPLWAIDSFKSEEYEKITIYSWGDFLEIHLVDRRSPPHLDPLGRAVPLAVSDGQLFIGSSTEDVKSAINASMNKKPSLTDIPEYVLVAQYMHDLNTIGLLIIDEVLLQDALDAAESYYGPKLKNFTTVGMGLGKDDKGEYMALVIVFEDSEAAEEGISVLEQKIEVYNKIYDMNDNNSKYYIYDSEINVDNMVVSAKLYTSDESLWRHWFINLWPYAFQAKQLINILPDCTTITPATIAD